MGRKTVEVGKVLRFANTFLSKETTNKDERESICAFIESILMQSGNYAGFRYLTDDWKIGGDDTRREYFVGDSIQADYDNAAKELMYG